ncbi:MAG: ATP-binding protein [Treponema sp.]|nr:ATP-binding protein [Treponema sp.]
MRFIAALIIIVIAFVITVVNFGSSMILTRNTLDETMSEDISIACDIANDFVSMKIDLYKSNARTAAELLMKAESPEDMENVMSRLLNEFMDFMAFTVLDKQGIIAEYGDSPTSINYLDHSEYIKNAFDGNTVFSTTKYNETSGKLVMYICTPMGKDRILSVTISGMIFSELLGDYLLRNTRSIFMLDENGIVIAHFMPELVTSRSNIADDHILFGSQISKSFFNEMQENEKGQGNFTIEGVNYQCAYSKISASKTGWYIGLSVPVTENLINKLQKRLLVLAIIFFAVGAAAAVICSSQIAKPYNKVAEQNRRLEELNEITRLQTEKIKEAHQLTQIMMDATPICSMLWDRKGNIFDCNEEAVKTFGVKDKKDFLDQIFNLSPEYQSDNFNNELYDGNVSSTESQTGYSRDLTMNLINKTLSEGRVCFKWMHQQSDGTLIPCEITSVRVSKDDDYIIAAYARDLREHNQMMNETQRLQTELEAALKEAQEANRAKSSFLANMSHEMRTPLNAVVGLSELILNTGELNANTENKLNKIYNSGMTLLGIVNDILDISKIESGKFVLHPIRYETPSLINDIVSLNIVSIGEKPIKFILSVNDKLPKQLFGDDLRIKQIFNNLLSNAFKYTDAGIVEWKITFEQDGDDIWLISDVMDTGKGMKNKDIPKLFIDYSQVDAETTRKTESTGLGLSITKNLVEMMDGTINVESEYGKGMTFSVRLRQRFVSNVPIGMETVKNIMHARYADNKRTMLKRIDLSYACVLVVDDMPVNLDVARGMLIPYGLYVDCASSGQMAIDMIRNENPRYDAVFMDHMMPGMDGIEAVRIIREDIGTDYARNVPVIALTANAISGNEQMFLENGFQAFISKPIDMIRMDSILRKWVEKKDYKEGNNTEGSEHIS